jgi:RNA polymerase sigma-70 factor (ECF subfamily)
MDANEERALVQRARTGDPGAFEDLVIEYERVIYTLALRMTGNVEDARDATQTVFLKVFRAFDTFDARRRFFSWIYRIAVNECLTTRDRRRPAEELGEEHVDPKPGPDETSERRDRESAIQDALLELNDGDRELLILRYWLERSYTEIGEVLAIPEALVRSRLFEARRRLGRRLKTRGVEA